jgi:GNAT superfamily N-acetyltransferase
LRTSVLTPAPSLAARFTALRVEIAAGLTAACVKLPISISVGRGLHSGTSGPYLARRSGRTLLGGDRRHRRGPCRLLLVHRDITMINTETLDRFAGLACLEFTYPKYRQMLLGATAQGPVTAVQASVDDIPAGLALAANAPGTDSAWIYSLYVAPAYRNLGLAKRLMQHLERDLRARGLHRMSVGYLTGPATTAHFERLLSADAWAAPKPDRIVCRCDYRALNAEWMLRPPKLPSDYEIFAWSDLPSEERAAFVASGARQYWIHPMLDPFKSDRPREFNSVGMRYRGQLVGWVLTERFNEETLLYSCSYMRPDLQRRARIVPLYVEAVRRHAERPALFPKAVWMVPFTFPAMVAFVRRRIGAHAESVEEYRVATKEL